MRQGKCVKWFSLMGKKMCHAARNRRDVSLINRDKLSTMRRKMRRQSYKMANNQNYAYMSMN